MHNGLESVVVALGTRFERPEHFAPSFLVEAYTKTPEGWRRDATWKTSVIHREIGTGKWKQFGAPRDFSAPTSAAEFKALEEKSKKESGK